MSQPSATNLPRLSIITVVFQCPEGLAATMASVARCQYPGLDYIVIDGGSRDGTVEVIKANSAVVSSWTSEPDRGIYDAMNKGIARCHPDSFILMLNAGDCLEADPRDYAGAMIDPSCVYYGDFSRLSAGTRRTVASDHRSLRDHSSICHQSVWIHAGLYRRCGTYDAALRIAADYDLLLRLDQDGVGFNKLPAVVASVTDEGVSEKRFVLGLKEQAASKRRCSLPWRWAYLRQFAKHQLRRLALAALGRRRYAGLLGGR